MGAASIIEQRWSQRRAVVLGVDVFDHGSLLVSCRSRDVGLGGVFLEAEGGQFKHDQDVELFFSLGEDGSTKHKLKAKVVRVFDQGAGFVFKDFDTSSFRSLQEIMRHSVTAV